MLEEITETKESFFKRFKTTILVTFSIFFVLSVATFPLYLEIVEDGEAGMKFVYGSVQKKALTAGWHFHRPFVTKIEVTNIKTQEVTERANVPSSEGLISTLDVSVLFHVPVDNVISVRTDIGRNYRKIVLVPIVRDGIRSVVSGYPVKALFSEQGRNEISEKLFTKLKATLETKGIIVQNVLLRDVSLPETFSRSIQMKLKAEQEALQKEFELQKATKDAQIEVERAKGVAESNEIIAGSITEEYLRYRFIEGLHNGENQVIYIPTEAGLPLVEASRALLEQAK